MKYLAFSCGAVLLICLTHRVAAESPKTERVVFSQYCFWTGEMKFGQMEGVVKTEAGFLDGHEVTQVDYDPAKVSLSELVRHGQNEQVADSIYVTNAEQAKLAQAEKIPVKSLENGYRKAPESDQKKQLQGTAAAKLDLTPMQATKVNAWIRTDPGKAMPFLTASQKSRIQ